MTRKQIALLCLVSFVVLIGSYRSQAHRRLRIDCEKYRLQNGLEVILHEDRSDPITAVAIQYHVGSSREVPGRTGFAHLFEHLMFKESQHVGPDQFSKHIRSAGGTWNGQTSPDGTVYFEVVPKNALEMVLWMESDRMGYLLSRVTQEAFANQQNVVLNEKRMSVDNRPYGHTDYVISKLLYPEGHPYNWEVIGSMEDLGNATLRDIHEFHRMWYRPGNATLVIAGDLDRDQTRAWIEKYFGEIPAGQDTPDPNPMPVTLDKAKRAFHEDSLATAPELTMVFPTVEEYHHDMYALDLLADVLTRGKKVPLYKVIVEEKTLAPGVFGRHEAREMAGSFQIRVRAFPTVGLGDVESAVHEAFGRFEAEGFTEQDLKRIKARLLTSFYGTLSSVLSKAFTLAKYNEYAGSPDYFSEYIDHLLSVTSDDIWRVYRTYLHNRPYVLTSFVPKGRADLVAKDSERFRIQEESVRNQAEAKAAPSQKSDIEVQDIPSRIDRRSEPPQGPAPLLHSPQVWEGRLPSGIKVYGIEHHELPLVQFIICIQGGRLLDEPGKEGQAYLCARLLMQGTQHKTPIQLQDAIDDVGASINVRATQESVSVSGSGLVSELDGLVALVREILMEPRWDEKEFARIRQETLELIRRSKDDPLSVAYQVFDKLVYGRDHRLAQFYVGTESSMASMTIDDLKRYYAANLSHTLSYIAVAGDLSKAQALSTFKSLASWTPKKEVQVDVPAPSPQARSRLYFVDVPDAKQSELLIGHLGLPYTHPDFYAATAMNFKLGGAFNSILNTILREEKGYTYRAWSSFTGSRYPGVFWVYSPVRSTATRESVRIIRDELARYREGISDQDLQFTRDALIKSNTRRFETLGDQVRMLDDIAFYGLPFDYVKQEERTVLGMTVTEHRRLAQQYIHSDKMIYLVVGDAKTQMAALSQLGLGEPILLDKDGNSVDVPASVPKNGESGIHFSHSGSASQ
jgi:zinc protease